MKKTIINIILAAATLFLGASCQEQPDVFQRDTDAISVDCNSQSVKHYVLVSGHWTLETNESWISFEPAEGDGDGTNFQPYYVKVAYNKGDARQGEFFLCHNGQRASVIVSQGPCNFKFGALSFVGTLAQNEPSTASVSVAYSGASGEESFAYTGTIKGEGAEGLSIQPDTYTGLTAGKGSMVIPISGTPSASGDVTIEISVDGKVLGSVNAKVAADIPDEPALPFWGLPCGWNFYATGMSAAEVQQSEIYGIHWFGVKTADAYVPATLGENDKAKFSTVYVNGTCSDRTFNPSIQTKGMLTGDYWLATIPVTGVKADTKLEIELGCGGAGGSVGFYLLEWSMDGFTWTVVDGASSQTRGDDTFSAHLWNTPSSISTSGYPNTRKTYDKATDDTYRKYNVTVPAINNGTLYFRLVALKYKASANSTDAVAAGWTDIKGFEVTVVE